MPRDQAEICHIEFANEDVSGMRAKETDAARTVTRPTALHVRNRSELDPEANPATGYLSSSSDYSTGSDEEDPNLQDEEDRNLQAALHLSLIHQSGVDAPSHASGQTSGEGDHARPDRPENEAGLEQMLPLLENSGTQGAGLASISKTLMREREKIDRRILWKSSLERNSSTTRLESVPENEHVKVRLDGTRSSPSSPETRSPSTFPLPPSPSSSDEEMDEEMHIETAVAIEQPPGSVVSEVRPVTVTVTERDGSSSPTKRKLEMVAQPPKRSKADNGASRRERL